MIYFIQPARGGLIKIGYATDPTKRIAEIQRMSPVTLNVLAVIDGDRKREAELHFQFASLRVHGEWFRAEKRLLESIGLFPQRMKLRRSRRLSASKRGEKIQPVTPEPATSEPGLEKHYKIKDVARMNGISTRTIRRWIHAGKIKAVELPGGRYGTEWRIPLSALADQGFSVIDGNGHCQEAK